MHIAILTAGGAGMFCGSCMHDNFWAKALIAAGCEASLIPTYTPLQLDDVNQGSDRVFLGGLNVYLNGRLRWWNRLPRPFTKWLDSARVIQWATRMSVSNDARELGELTLSMLQGEHGPHREAIQDLAGFLGKELKPDVLIFSNALLVGALHEIRQHWDGPVLCMLQGDDVFLDSLPESYQERVISLISEKAAEFDRFLTHTEFYKKYMSDYLRIPIDRFRVLPLSIDLAPHTGEPKAGPDGPFTVGYFARFAPEKGFHHLTDAFLRLHETIPEARLRVGGYLGPQHRGYFEEQLAKLKQAGIDVDHIGSPNTVDEKVQFLNSLDVLSVPTEFLEPKGLYILEAMANGIPVVQPAHGAFPEHLERTGGGLLVEPKNSQALADGLTQFSAPEYRTQFAAAGWHGVREHYTAEKLATKTVEIANELTTSPPSTDNAPHPS